jgi:sugar/nucleoside kinase (ribokinase family)
VRAREEDSTLKRGRARRDKVRVLTFGEALVGYGSVEPTLRTATQFTRFSGGADLNVAVGLTHLGVHATWASVLGDDAHGDYLADAVRQLGITPLVRRAAGPTALMFKAGGAEGDPEVLQIRHHTAFAQHADALLTADVLALDGIDHLHLSGITLGISPVVRATALSLLEAASAAHVSVSFDPNLRLNLWPDHDEMRTLLNTVSARAQVVLPGIGEARLLTGHDDPEAIAETYLRAGAAQVVIKLGAAGARAFTSDGQIAQSRPFAVTPIDTVGAGDGFAAGYIAGLLTGAHLQQRLDQAAAVGALVTTRRGDLTAMPTRAEVDQLLSHPTVAA